MMKNKKRKKPGIELTEEGIDNLIQLAKTLKKIHTRLLAEGYVIEDGKIYKPEKKK